MDRAARRISVGTITALFLASGGISSLCAQTVPAPLTVVGNAGEPSALLTTVGQQVTVSLGADVYNPPTATYPCTVQGPIWSWSTQDPPAPMLQVVQYAATSGAWGAPPPGSCNLSITQPDPTVADATLTVTFNQPGYWRLSPVATAAFNDSPCSDTWQATGQVTIADITVITVTFDTSPVSIANPGDTAPVNATVVPADAAPLVTFDTFDHSVATVTAASQSSPVPLTVTGVAAGDTQMLAWLYPYEGPTVDIGVAAPLTPVKVPLGGSINGKGDMTFKIWVPTATGGILNVTTSAGTLGTLLHPDGTPYTNNTETGFKQQGWYTFTVTGAPTYTVSNTFTQKGQATTRPWNFYYWSTQGPYIREPLTGGNGKADSTVKAGSDDRQSIATGAAAGAGKPIITAGPDGDLDSTKGGDDEVRDMPGILNHPNLFTTFGTYLPLIKYDAIHGTTARATELAISDGMDKAGTNAEWCGNCLGATVASLWLFEPKPAVGTKYNSDELKGLWAKMGENSNVPGGIAWGLNVTNIPPGPPKPGADPTDDYAPAFHDLLEGHVKMAKAALVCNLRVKSATPPDRQNEVWNHAVYSFTATFAEAPGGNENVVTITNQLLANQDEPPPTAGSTTDRKPSAVYIITYTAGNPDTTKTADWVNVGGDATYAPANLLEVVGVNWVQGGTYQNTLITEKNVRADDDAN